jgi:hypothetical protein
LRRSKRKRRRRRRRGRRKRRDVTVCGLVGTYQHVATFVVAFYSEEEQHFVIALPYRSCL